MLRVMQLRGCGGSGKTTVVRNLWDDPRGEWAPEYGPLFFPDGIKVRKKVVPRGYISKPWNLYIGGHYHIACGGCEGLTMVEIAARVRHAVFDLGLSMIFEGLFISNSIGHFQRLDDELKTEGVEYVNGMMAAPLNVCLERIQHRRTLKGNPRILNPKSTTEGHSRMPGVARSLAKRNIGVEWLPFEHEIERVREFFNLPPRLS